MSKPTVHSIASYLARYPRTAAQVAKQFKLPSAVTAKRLIAKAGTAGFKVMVTKGDKPKGQRGRRPFVFKTVPTAEAAVMGAYA